MTVKELIVAAAISLGIAENVNAYLENGDSVGQKDTERLLECFNLVENELALDYLPLYAEETLQSATGSIDFSALSKAAVRILQVTDEWGNSVKYRLFPDYLKTQPGKLLISYTYTPKRKELGEESDFVLQASSRLFAYGMAAEYSLMTGRYEEAAIWDKKYKEAIDAAYRARPCERIKSRSWV